MDDNTPPLRRVRNIQSNLNLFDFEKYNKLQEVEIADRILKQRKEFNKLLEKVHTLTREYNIELGLRLIHKHLLLDEGKIMVEKFSIFGGKPAYITSPDYISENIYPASWLIINDTLFVYEYSTDEHVKKTLERLEEDSYVLEEIVRLIKQYNLETLIAPCIHARNTLIHFDKNEELVERTYSNPLANIIQYKDDKASNTVNQSITTLWGAPVTLACFTVVRCEVEGDSHFPWDYHVPKN